MLGFNYMQVRGTEFPLWFTILMLVFVVGAFIFMLVYIFLSNRSEKKAAAEESEKPSYMGEDRLLKILSHYILGRYGAEVHNSFTSSLKECKQKRFYTERKRKTGVFYTYTQTNGFPAGNEWLNCICFGYEFLIEACGIKSKRVTITDYHQKQCGTIFTFYDENYIPKPNETFLPPNIKPFTGGKTTYNGIDRDTCVCYDIAKDK